MARTTITVEHDKASNLNIPAGTTSARIAAIRTINFLRGVMGGAFGATSMSISQDPASATVTISGVDGVAATGSYALSGVGGTAATGNVTFDTSSGPWTATINGVAFGGTVVSDAAAAEELYLAINESADPLVAGIVTATWNGVDGVVSLAADAKGTAGNAVTLAVTGTGVSRSAATLTGGVDGAVTVVINGTSVGPVDTTDMADDDAATAVAAAIEADETLGPLLVAVDSTTNVNLTWGVKGTVGNAVTLAAGVSATGTATRSGATMTGGENSTVTVTAGGAEVVTATTTLSNSAAATAVAVAINADSDAAEIVEASADGAVVTLSAIASGEAGNGISLTSTASHGTATASAANLSGGTEMEFTF